MLHFLVLLLALAIPSSAFAEASEGSTNEDYARPGFYLGLSGVGAIETFDNELDNVSLSSGGGFNVRGGYRVNEFLAVEAQVEYVAGFEDSFFLFDDGKVKYSAVSMTGNAKFYPLQGRFQPFLGVGLGFINGQLDLFSSDDDTTAGVVRLGGGLDFYLTESWVISSEVDWVKPFAGNKVFGAKLEDFSYVTIGGGVSYRF
jgi:hypothetical protein